MKIGFTVGEIEQHQMELSFDQPSGDLSVMMDGAQVLRDKPRRRKGPVKRYELQIGEREQHKLAVQLTFEDEESRRREVESSEPIPLQLSFGDTPDEEMEQEPIVWPIQALPRVSLVVSAVGD